MFCAFGAWMEALNRAAIRADIAANRPLLDERLLAIVQPGDTVVVVAEMFGLSRIDESRVKEACKAMAAQLDARGIEVVVVPLHCKNVVALTRCVSDPAKQPGDGIGSRSHRANNLNATKTED